VTDVLSDFRRAWRGIRRAPGFSALAVCTLGLGIAAAATVFALVDGVLHERIGGVRLDDVFVLSLADRRGQAHALREPQFRELAANPPAEVASIIGVTDWMQTVGRIYGRADELAFQGLSGHAADVLGLRAQLGRWIVPDDDRAEETEAVAVISEPLWREWFGGQASAIGSALRLGDTSFRVVGIAAPDFAGMFGGTMPTDVWVPLAQTAMAAPEPWRGVFAKSGVPTRARLKLRYGVAPASAAAAIGAWHGLVADGDVLRASISPAGVRQGNAAAATLITVLSLTVLAGACANLANMLCARHAVRAGDLAVRVSLGAARGRLLRQTLVESTTLAALGSVAGIAFAAFAIAGIDAAFGATNVAGTRLALHVDLDVRVLVYGAAIGLASGLLVGMVVAIQTTRTTPLRLLSGSVGTTTGLTPAARRVRMALVAVQVTAAVVLVMGTGVIFERTRSAVDAGWNLRIDVDRLAAGRFNLQRDGLHEGEGRYFYDRIVGTAGQLPGVERAAIVNVLPGDASEFMGASARFLLTADSQRERVSGRPRRADARMLRATPGVFDTLGLRITRGRAFHASDAEGAALVAVLSESAADALWPGEDAIGRSLRIGGSDDWVTVVGLVEDPVRGHRNSRVEETREDVVSIRPSNVIFVPLAQHYSPSAWVLVRSERPEAQIDSLRALVAGIHEDVALLDAGVAASRLDWLGPYRAVVSLVLGLGAVALVISMLGVYGVVSYFVSARTREIGIRLALGAPRGRVIRMTIDYAVHIMLVGLLPGVYVAAAGSRWLEASFVRLVPNSIATWIVVPVFILLSGVLAALVPAWRAARVDPNVALRAL
jgi:predicted permease